MPAKNLHRTLAKGIYSHIYNKGVDDRVIFNDGQDYETFQAFLNDYLSAPKDPESVKKDFKVNGRTFRGTPHQPKNYLNKVELIAYSLMPNHFHLLLHQVTEGSLESFIRSLCTRYSIYFNKKYQRTGSLFQGPYKSVHIQDELRLLYLTRYLHQAKGRCSYEEYLGERETSWVKPKVIMSHFGKFGKNVSDYKLFVEKYELDQKEKGLLEGITFESDTEHLQRRDLSRDEKAYQEKVQNTPPALGLNIDISEYRSNIPHFLAISTAVFVLLVTLGIGNIILSNTKNSQRLPTQESN